MAVYTYPSTSKFLPATFEIGLRSSVIVSTSALSGNVQTVEIPGSRWVVGMMYAGQVLADRAEVEAFWVKVQGQINRVSLWHLSRPAPRGSMRGSPVMASTAAIGATTAAITTTPAATVKAGDMLGLGGQLVQILADAQADGGGALTVSFAPRLRAAATSGSAVVWDKPTANFILTTPEVRVPYQSALGVEYSVDMAEVWA